MMKPLNMLDNCIECVFCSCCGAIVIVYVLSGVYGFIGVILGNICIFSVCNVKVLGKVVNSLPAHEDGKCIVQFTYNAYERHYNKTVITGCGIDGQDKINVCYIASDPSKYTLDMSEYTSLKTCDALWMSGLVSLVLFVMVSIALYVSGRAKEPAPMPVYTPDITALRNRLDRFEQGHKQSDHETTVRLCPPAPAQLHGLSLSQ